MPQTVVGVDVGATLAKLAVREAGEPVRFEHLPAAALDELARRVRALDPDRIGLTGCGASALEPRLDRTPHRLLEFDAWALGSRELLRAQCVDVDEPYLLVSVGTGTSVLRIEGERVTRLGGTALGGGTVLGLGAALTGRRSHDEICALARRGQRARVDLLIRDIYAPGEIALPGEATAAAFGNLARHLVTRARDPRGEAHERGGGAPDAPGAEDLAAAVMGMVGENVARIGCTLAVAAGVRRVVFGGATLLDNELLRNILVAVTAALGREPLVLAQAGFAGAVGALGYAAAAASAEA